MQFVVRSPGLGDGFADQWILNSYDQWRQMAAGAGASAAVAISKSMHHMILGHLRKWAMEGEVFAVRTGVIVTTNGSVEASMGVDVIDHTFRTPLTI